MDPDTLRTELTSSLESCVEPGHWAFYDYWGNEIGHSLERINVPKMYESRDKWAELVAGGLLEQPTGGIAMVSYAHSVDWVASIKAALERRGARLSVTGMALTGEVLSGDGWSASHPTQPVTILNDICTLGTDLVRMRHRLRIRRIPVAGFHALVHRGPSLPAKYEGLPYRASVHFPQALLDVASCPACGRAEAIRPLRA